MRLMLCVVLGIVMASCHSNKKVSVDKLTSAIVQRALNKGGEIILPAGRIYLEESLIIKVKGTTFSGAGMEKTILDFNPGKGIEVLASNVKVSDMHLTNTFIKDGKEQHSLNVRGPFSKVHIDKIKVTNGDDTGIRIGYALRQGERAVAFNCKVTNCVIDGIQEGSGIEVMTAEHIIVENNKITNTFQNGIRIASGRNCTVRNNRIDNYNLSGVRYSSGIYARAGNGKKFWNFCRDIDIIGNTIIGKTKCIGAGTQTENLNIKDNTLIIDDQKNGVGISLENNKRGAAFGYRNVQIANNKITGSFKSGVELHTRDNDPAISGQYVEIVNNTIDGFVKAGVTMRGNNVGEVRDITVQKNKLIPKTSGAGSSGIIISRCRDINVFNNEIKLPEAKKIMLLNNSTIRRQ